MRQRKLSDGSLTVHNLALKITWMLSNLLKLQQLKWHPKYCTQLTCWICMEGFLNKRMVLQRACTMPGQLDILAMMEQMPKRWETRKSSNSIATALQRNKWDQKKTLEQLKTYARGNAVESPWNLTTDYSFWEPLHNNSTVAARTNYFKQLKALEPLLQTIHSSFGERIHNDPTQCCRGQTTASFTEAGDGTEKHDALETDSTCRN